MLAPVDGPVARDLLVAITRCPNVRTCLADAGAEHPCTSIVASQGTGKLLDHQVPEPWSGALDQAPMLFFGSNPSISATEEYPRGSWSDQEIEDFFVHRFGGGRKAWVRDGRYTLLRDGTYNRSWVRFWGGVRGRAQELMPERTVRPGIDYVLSEVVHCKSKREIGVSEALEECAGRYLEKVIALSAARVVVLLGKQSRRAAAYVFDVSGDERVVGPLSVGARPRYFAFLPHPNARQQRTFAACFEPEELALLQAAVAGQEA